MTVGAVIGYYRAFALGICLFKSLYLILFHVYGAEDKIHLVGDFFHVLYSVHYNHVSHALRNFRLHCPAAADSVGIFLAGGASACGQAALC